MKMRLKSISALIAIVGLGLSLVAGGCHHRNNQAQASGSVESENVAPSDVTTDAKAGAKTKAKTDAGAKGETASADSGKAETNSIVDKGGEGVDFAEREEIRRSYALKPGANIRISGTNGPV